MGATAARLGGWLHLAGRKPIPRQEAPLLAFWGRRHSRCDAWVAHVAEQATLRGLGGRLVQGELAGAAELRRKPSANISPKRFRRAFEPGCGPTRGRRLGVGTQVAEQVAAGEPIHVSPTEQLLNLTLGQAPFAAAYLTRGGRVPWGRGHHRSHVAELENAIEPDPRAQEFQREQAGDQQQTLDGGNRGSARLDGAGRRR